MYPIFCLLKGNYNLLYDIRDAGLRPEAGLDYMSYSLNSLKGGYIGDYYRG